MTARPLVSVFSADKHQVLENKIALPGVFSAPIRDDIVLFVHSNLSKNSRQAHGVDNRAGHKHSAESWGTGRAVARIPRVSGSGTHRAGQAAFGNMCRKGRMFAPLKTWRRWHRKVNLKQRRHAVAAALAASAVTPLVMARGHRIANVLEIPLVLEDKIENIEFTRDAKKLLENVGAIDDVEKVRDNKRIRAGKGKLRNRRYRLRKGPLVVYANENVKLVKAFRNIPGVECSNVHRMNLKQLAPGGQLGRFIIWTQSAFKALDQIFGTHRKQAVEKHEYQLQRPMLTNADIARIINSNEVQLAIKPVKHNQVLHDIQKKNPLKNRKTMDKLNPNAKIVRETAKRQNEANQKKRTEALAKKRGLTASMTKEQKVAVKGRKKASKAWINNVLGNLDEAYKQDKAVEVALKNAQLGAEAGLDIEGPDAADSDEE